MIHLQVDLLLHFQDFMEDLCIKEGGIYFLLSYGKGGSLQLHQATSALKDPIPPSPHIGVTK